MSSQQLHFIIGMGRSGTTILSKLLNRYKDVHALPEINFFTFFFHHYSKKKQFTSADVELIFQQIELYTATHYTPIWEIELEQAKQRVLIELNKNPKLDYLSLCKLLFKEIKVVGIDKSQANILLHKSPITTLFADKIRGQFPQTKFIWIVRDYRASILSLKQSVHSKIPDVAYNATRWHSYNKRALDLQQQHPNNVLLVRYEDLVTHSEDEFNRIEKFLNIDKVYETVDFEKTQLEKIEQLPLTDKQKQRYLKKHSDLQKPLNTDRLSAWKEELTLQDLEIGESICNSLGNKLGYLPTTTVNHWGKKISSLKPILKADWHICKELILYYLPINLKINRLKK